MRHYDIKIQGRVHGVGFRWSTLQKAKGLHITGFIRNENHHTVYMEAEGQEDDLEEFLGWCHHGPLFAKVKNLDFNEGALKSYHKFEIKF